MAVEWIEINFAAPTIPGVGRRDTPPSSPTSSIEARVQFLSTGLNWMSVNRRIRVSLREMSPRAETVLRSRRSCGVAILIHFQEIRNEWLTQYMYIGHTQDLRAFPTPQAAIQHFQETPSYRAGAPHGNIVERMFWGRLA
jgi:hypothetical protein